MILLLATELYEFPLLLTESFSQNLAPPPPDAMPQYRESIASLPPSPPPSR